MSGGFMWWAGFAAQVVAEAALRDAKRIAEWVRFWAVAMGGRA
jgi:hypothetical protein